MIQWSAITNYPCVKIVFCQICLNCCLLIGCFKYIIIRVPLGDNHESVKNNIKNEITYQIFDDKFLQGTISVNLGNFIYNLI